MRSQYVHGKCSLGQVVLQFHIQAKAVYHTKVSSLWTNAKNDFFSRPCRSTLVISRIFKYSITKYKFERFWLKCFCTIGWSSYYDVSILTLPWISKSLVLTGTCQFHWAEELPWHTVVTDQNNLQHSLKWKVSSLDLFKILCLLLIFLSLTPFANFGNKFTRYFFISFEYNLSDVHLGGSSLLFSNGKELGVASEIPFSNEL